MSDPTVNRIYVTFQDHRSFFHFHKSFVTTYSDRANYETNNQTIYELLLYFIMGFLGLLGNIVTCVVIVNNKSMRTITNVYLFNLAISDILLLFFGFPSLNRYLSYRYDILCKFRSLMFECAINVSVLTISGFSIERYLAICHPFRALVLSDTTRVWRIILAIWILGLLCALSISLQIGFLPKTVFSKDDVCSIVSDFAPRILEISSFVFFLLPMLLMIYLYSKVWSNLKHLRPIDESKETDARDNRHRRIIRMLVIIVTTFFICWAPFHAQRLLTAHLFHLVNLRGVVIAQRRFSRVTGVLYYVSAVINPFIYNIMCKKFRKAFKESLARGFMISRCNYCSRVVDRREVVIHV